MRTVGRILLYVLGAALAFLLVRRAAIALVDALWPEYVEALSRLVVLSVAALFVLLMVALIWDLYRDRIWGGPSFPLVFFPVLGLFFLTLLSLGGYWFDTHVGQQGAMAVGTVTAKRVATSLDAETGYTTDYWLSVRYPAAGGRFYERHDSVSRACFDSMQEGDTVTVYYWPRFPRIAALEVAVRPRARHLHPSAAAMRF